MYYTYFTFSVQAHWHFFVLLIYIFIQATSPPPLSLNHSPRDRWPMCQQYPWLLPVLDTLSFLILVFPFTCPWLSYYLTASKSVLAKAGYSTIVLPWLHWGCLWHRWRPGRCLHHTCLLRAFCFLNNFLQMQTNFWDHISTYHWGIFLTLWSLTYIWTFCPGDHLLR